jgi:DNA topoisomerase-1
MQLVVVESPTKARTLTNFLGQGFKVMATMGHIKDLPKSTLGIDIKKNFEPQFEPVLKKSEVISELEKKGKTAQKIFLATDPDREGEAISQHVAEILKSKSKIKRIVFHEITKEAVEEAIVNPREIDTNLVDAQIARRVLDRLVGYKLSPLLWRKVRRGLSAGRVQTVVVRLIVEREREIEAFKPQEYWEVSCQVKSRKLKVKNGEFVIWLIKVGEKKAEINNKREANSVVSDLEKSEYRVLTVKKNEVRKNPYPPFTTSTMTQAGARIFGWSAKRTMSVAQHLYEQGLITYHRTDSTNIAKAAITKVRNYVKKEYGEDYLPAEPKFYKVHSRVAQEAHEAIRPTNIGNGLNKEKLTKEEEILYNLIWRRFVACQMTASVYDETTIDVIASLEHKAESIKQYTLRASGQVMKFDGWKKVILNNISGEVALPEVVEGELLQLIKVNSEQKFTEPPARYNEASLIKTLEKLGIGRPSTYAPTISTIQIRNYVEKKEGKFFATPVGTAVNDFLLKNFPDVFEYQFTAEMEEDLDKIANGENPWREPIKKFWNPFSKKLNVVTKESKRVKIDFEKTGKKCPKCKKGELVIRIGRFGKFISCSRFPKCDFTDKFIEKIKMKCPECVSKGLPAGRQGDVIIKTTRKGKRFFGCSRYPECSWASWKNPKVEQKPNK